MMANEKNGDPVLPPFLSATIIHILCSQSPRHAWTAHPVLNPEYKPEEAEHFDIGTAAHAILLEGIDKAQVLDFPDWRTKDARTARDEIRASGGVPLLRKSYDAVLAMVASARVQLDQHHDGKRAFRDGKPEERILWNEDGIYAKARLDWVMNDHSAIWDYKTTSGSANPEIVSKNLFNTGGDVQAAWYLRGLKAVHEDDRPPMLGSHGRTFVPKFYFVIQETYPPYALSVVSLGPDAMFLAEKKITWAMEQWRKCLETNDWPGYPDKTCYVGLPTYIEEQWLRKEVL